MDQFLSKPPSSAWSCTACTFRNTPGCSKCTICNTIHPIEAEAAQPTTTTTTRTTRTSTLTAMSAPHADSNSSSHTADSKHSGPVPKRARLHPPSSPPPVVMYERFESGGPLKKVVVPLFAGDTAAHGTATAVMRALGPDARLIELTSDGSSWMVWSPGWRAPASRDSAPAVTAVPTMQKHMYWLDVSASSL
jgi:hypothetical protein